MVQGHAADGRREGLGTAYGKTKKHTKRQGHTDDHWPVTIQQLSALPATCTQSEKQRNQRSMVQGHVADGRREELATAHGKTNKNRKRQGHTDDHWPVTIQQVSA